MSDSNVTNSETSPVPQATADTTSSASPSEETYSPYRWQPKSPADWKERLEDQLTLVSNCAKDITDYQDIDGLRAAIDDLMWISRFGYDFYHKPLPAWWAKAQKQGKTKIDNRPTLTLEDLGL